MGILPKVLCIKLGESKEFQKDKIEQKFITMDIIIVERDVFYVIGQTSISLS